MKEVRDRASTSFPTTFEEQCYIRFQQATKEAKEHFYADWDRAIYDQTNGLTRVQGDFNASFRESVPGVVGLSRTE